MKDYHINIFFSEEDDGYVADIPDLAMCSAFGETPAKALAEVEVAKELWRNAARAEGKSIPKPSYRAAIYRLAMTEDQRREFDSLKDLLDNEWREFENKVANEWKLSFGIWTALFTSVGSIATGKIAPVPHWSAWLISALLVTIHVYFLVWTQYRLHSIRSRQKTILIRCRSLLPNVSNFKPDDRKPWNQPAVLTQIAVTLLLAFFLLKSSNAI